MKVRQWEGCVLEVDGDMFTAEVTLVDGSEQPMVADFEVAQLAADGQGVRAGDVFSLTTCTVMKRHDLGAWTEREVADVQVKAKEAAARLAEIAD